MVWRGVESACGGTASPKTFASMEKKGAPTIEGWIANAGLWISGSHGPSGEHLVSLIRHSDAVLVSVFAMAGRSDSIVALELVELREKVEKIRELIDAILTGGGERER